MRQKYQRGSLKKQKGKWIGMFYDSTGSHRSRVLGTVKSLSKTQARAAVNKFADEANAKVDENRVWTFKEFVDETYLPYYGRRWKRSTKENNSVPGKHTFGQRVRRAALVQPQAG